MLKRTWSLASSELFGEAIEVALRGVGRLQGLSLRLRPDPYRRRSFHPRTLTPNTVLGLKNSGISSSLESSPDFNLVCRSLMIASLSNTPLM